MSILVCLSLGRQGLEYGTESAQNTGEQTYREREDAETSAGRICGLQVLSVTYAVNVLYSLFSQ